MIYVVTKCWVLLKREKGSCKPSYVSRKTNSFDPSSHDRNHPSLVFTIYTKLRDLIGVFLYGPGSTVLNSLRFYLFRVIHCFVHTLLFRLSHSNITGSSFHKDLSFIKFFVFLMVSLVFYIVSIVFFLNVFITLVYTTDFEH